MGEVFKMIEEESHDDFFMGLIFWFLMGLAHVAFVYNFIKELTYYEIEKTNQEITEEWKNHDSAR